jgi:hypothetical protein
MLLKDVGNYALVKRSLEYALHSELPKWRIGGLLSLMTLKCLYDLVHTLVWSATRQWVRQLLLGIFLVVAQAQGLRQPLPKWPFNSRLILWYIWYQLALMFLRVLSLDAPFELILLLKEQAGCAEAKAAVLH